MANNSHTDEDLLDQTEEVLDQDEPSEDDEVEEKPKTRAEKTAAKAGKTVEELREEKAAVSRLEKLNKELEDKVKILKNYEPLLKEAETKSLKAEFESKGLDGVSFEAFESEYSDLIAIGADTEKAKELALKRAKEKAGYKEAENRKDGRDNASHPPVSSPNPVTHKFPLMSQKSFSSLVVDKGTVYYKEYIKYCDENYGGKYFQ